MIFDRQKRQGQQLPITMFFQPSKKEKVPVASTVVEEIIDEEESTHLPQKRKCCPWKRHHLLKICKMSLAAQ